MNYQETMAYIEEVSPLGSILGLETEQELLRRLHNPQDRIPVVHIAGTNGKGSILAYLESVLERAGYRVGRYLSPTIFEYRERFQVNGVYISEEKLASYMTRVKAVADEMQKEGHAYPTPFELETALSFLYSYEEKVDVLLLETGLGGRLDATNVVANPLCVILASISMDHMQYLGDDLASIAFEKAGIIKEHAKVVFYPNNETVTQVIRDVCKKRNAVWIPVLKEPLQLHDNGIQGIRFDYGKYQNLEIPLLGEHQIWNALTALTALEVLRETYSLSDAAIMDGFQAVQWPGRFEIVQKDPLVIRDGAHNEDAARQLANALQQYVPDKKLVYLMGVLADKEYDKILKIMAPMASSLIAITPDNSRALPKEKLADAARKYYADVQTADTLDMALTAAKERSGRDGVVVAFGSLSFIGALV